MRIPDIGRGPALVAAACGAAAGAALLARPRLTFLLAAILAAAAVPTIIVLSGSLWPAAVAFTVLIVCEGVGNALLRRCGLTPRSILERVALAVPLGVTAFGMVVLFLGLLGALYTGVIVLLLAGGAFLTWMSRGRGAAPEASPERHRAGKKPFAKKKYRPPVVRERYFLGLAILLPLVTGLLWALAPETNFDALNYHLPVPRDWLAAHRIVALPYWHSNFGHLAEAFFVIPLALGGAIAVKLAVYGLGAVLVAATSALADALFGSRAALWSAALAATTPILVSSGTTVGADALLALFIASSVLAGLGRWNEPGRLGWAAAAGALGGAAIGTKVNGAFAIVVPAILLLFALFRSRTRAPAGVGLASMALVSLPWFAMTWRFTGNPVFPFFNGWFRSPGYSPVNDFMNASLFGIGTSLRAWAILPFALTFQTHLFSESSINGTVGFALLLLPLLLIPLSLRTLDRRHAFVVAVVVAYGIGWALVFQYSRYFTAVLPLILAIVAGSVLALSPRARAFSLAGIGLALLAQLFLVFHASDRLPLALVVGRETPREFLRRAIPAMDGIEGLNRRAEVGDRVAGVGFDGSRYYLEPGLDSIPENPEFWTAVKKASGEDLRRFLWENRDRFVLIRLSRSRGFTPSFGAPKFLAEFTELVAADAQSALYRLRPPAPTAGPAHDGEASR